MNDPADKKTEPIRERKEATPSRGAEIVARLRGRAKSGMTTDEIMKMTRSDR